VGARRSSAYGRSVAEELGRMLATAGIPVVSGMASGIDSQAHRGALDGGGVTAAVLGGAPDVPYPRRNAHLYRRILDEGGAVVSELTPGSRSHRWSFPARNRIMAALGRVTVVVEATERSGSLITAGMAQDLGRDVGAVPGPVSSSLSRGTNRLIAEGALVVRHAQDVLDALLGPGVRAAAREGPEIGAPLGAALLEVERGSATCDSLAAALRAHPAEAAAALARLELLGYLESDAAGRYSRTALLTPR
jgi:DNA processing protein